MNEKQNREIRRALKAHAEKCGHLIESHFTCRQSTVDPMLWCIGCLCRAVLDSSVDRDSMDREWEHRVHSGFRLLEELGFRYCDAAACNCGSWHKS